MNQIVSVIGTIFMDVKGFARDAYLPAGRNLGKIEFIHGGVARNVAENLGLLGEPVALVSTLDQTSIGDEINLRLSNNGVNTEYLRKTAQNGMGMWLAILERDGNLAGSISQMPDLQLMEQLIADQGAEIIKASSHVILELDLNLELSQTVLQLAKQSGKPVFGIPGNLDVITSDPTLLRDVSCFICNNHEAARLIGGELTENDLPEKWMRLLKSYVEEQQLTSMVITLGAQGAVFYDSTTRQLGHQPVFPVNMVDSTGAGDAFFSGTVMGLVKGLALQDAVVCGTKVAGWTIESQENTCLELPKRIQHDGWFQKTFALIPS